MRLQTKMLAQEIKSAIKSAGDVKEGDVVSLCEVTVWNVPVDVKAKFKAFCARNDISMRAALIYLMRKFPDEN